MSMDPATRLLKLLSLLQMRREWGGVSSPSAWRWASVRSAAT